MDLGDCLIDNTGLSKMTGWKDRSLSLIENIKFPYQHHDLESYDSLENEIGLQPRFPLSMEINHAHNNWFGEFWLYSCQNLSHLYRELSLLFHLWLEYTENSACSNNWIC